MSTEIDSDYVSCSNSDMAMAFANIEKHGYEVGGKIGEGAFGYVVEAHHTEEDGQRTRLACKVVERKKAGEEFMARFFPRELDLLQKLNHSNIIEVHSILKSHGNTFIFMRYAENGDLLGYVHSNGPIKEVQAKTWFRQLVDAVKYLHEKDIAHRDIKLENILVSKNWNIKLTDFGFACFCRENTGRPVLSRTFCGSIPYIAPEIRDERKYNAKKADAWAAGVVLFGMLNAKLPFKCNDEAKLWRDQLKRNYEFKAKVKGTLSAAAIQAVNDLLEPNPRKRRTMRQMASGTWLKR